MILYLYNLHSPTAFVSSYKSDKKVSQRKTPLIFKKNSATHITKSIQNHGK